MAGAAATAFSRTARLRGAVPVLLALALLPLAEAGWLALEYARTQRDWLPARGVAIGRILLAPGEASGEAPRQVLRDEFVYEREGKSLTCHWDDALVAHVPWLARARSSARDRRWRSVLRPRLRVDPADPARCRPAYGWPEAVRLELTAPLLLAILLLGGALFLFLAPRAVNREERGAKEPQPRSGS